MSYYKKSSLTLAMLAAFTILPSSILGEQLLKPVSAQSAPTTNMAPALHSGRPRSFGIMSGCLRRYWSNWRDTFVADKR